MTQQLQTHFGPVSAVIFDLDGTLLDSMGVWAQIDIDFLGKRGLAVPPDYMEAITPLGFRATAEYTKARFSLPDTPEQLMDEWSAMAREMYHHHVQLKPGALRLLEELHRRGIPMGAASALSPELAIPCLESCGAADYLQVMVTADQVGSGKHLPEIWLRTAALLGTEPARCLAADDVAAALRGARAAGMVTAGLYDPHSGGREELKASAHLFAESPDELAQQLGI